MTHIDMMFWGYETPEPSCEQVFGCRPTELIEYRS